MSVVSNNENMSCHSSFFLFGDLSSFGGHLNDLFECTIPICVYTDEDHFIFSYFEGLYLLSGNIAPNALWTYREVLMLKHLSATLNQVQE